MVKLLFSVLASHVRSLEPSIAHQSSLPTRIAYAKMRVMRSASRFKSFLKGWQDALRAPDDLWQGQRAVADLKRAGYIEVSAGTSTRISMLNPVDRWRPREMLKNVFAEVSDYKRRKLAWKKEFRNTELFLAKIERMTLRQRSRTDDLRMKKLLGNTASVIERRHFVLRDFRNGTQRSPLGVWERLWPEHARAENIPREIELDTRLQVQAAKMFRTFLPRDEGVSLRTIARLVVLVYYIAELATENQKDGCLWTSNRAITVRSVEDKLRRKGIC
jgi:hypothetical protein